ncbi:hypothetical protein AB4Z38_08940 [Arthrobacter sp. 2RAF6]|uniref:hypothetical protein n=1 Tax=Arthrobacter sp. 2RAF6 TaxID=3233002 RepID=UPI003F8EA079
MSDPSRIDPYLVDAYVWLYQQMAAQLTSAGHGAIWSWARITRPDLADSCKVSIGQVLLT